MFKYISYIILSLVFTSCSSVNHKSKCKRKLLTSEMYDILNTSLKNETLEIIDLDCNKRSISQNKLIEIGKDSLKSEYWFGDNNKIYKLNCKGTQSLTERVLETLVLYHQVGYIPQRKLEDLKFEIDCNNLKETYDELVLIDQNIRNDPKMLESEFLEIDKQNLLKFIKTVNTCGTQIEYADQIWLLNQHSPLDIQMRNYLRLKEYNDSGHLSDKKLAYFQDRILMAWGFKQEYGSQMYGNEPAPIFDEQNVNKRRKAVGLKPIEEYVKQFQKNE